MYSIRRYLLVSLIIALTCGSLLVAVFSYFNTSDEIDELYDKNMVEIAETLKSQISALHLSEYGIRNITGQSLQEKIREEQELLIQIWDNNHEQIYTSHRAIPYPYQEKRGATITEFQGRSWRTYGIEADHFIIQVSQPQKARTRFVREMAAHLLLPMLALVPVVGIFIWLAVGRSLTPLNDISRAITKRSAISLEPIPEGNIPIEIKPLVQELNKLLVRLNISLETQRNFTADAAHQLRTPLTALQLQLGNLKRARTDKEREHNTTRLQDGIDRATHVVQQLLTLERVEPNGKEELMEPVDLNALAHEVVKEHAEMAVQKNIDLGISHSGNAVVTGSMENLRILMENILGNALRYTPEGGKVNVCTYPEAGNAFIIIQDNGIGIPESARGQVFERFYRMLGTEVEGTGLGLSIASNIVRQHAGKINIGEGIDGKGTSFTVILPLTKNIRKKEN